MQKRTTPTPWRVIHKEKYSEIACNGRDHRIVFWSPNEQEPCSAHFSRCDCDAIAKAEVA